MNIQLLQWGLFSFILGLIMSLPLAAVYYLKTPGMAKIFTNPRKLKSAHLDFLMQSFAIGFVFVLGFAMKFEFPMYVVIPIVYGSIGNPLIFLMESTPLHRTGIFAIIYKLLSATSPLALLFAWTVIAWHFLPGFMKLLLLVVIVVGLLTILFNQWRFKESTQNTKYSK